MVHVKEVSTNGELSFSTVSDFLDVVQRYSRNQYMRSKAVEVFVGHCIAKGSPDAFEVFRLVLPQSDRRVYPGVSQYRLVYLIVVVVRRLVEQFPGLAVGVANGGGAVGGDFYSRLFRWRDKDDLALAMGEPSELSEFLKEKVYDVFCGDRAKSEAERDLARRMGQARSPTVMEVNAKLDAFSDASRRHCVEDQVDVMGWFMERLSPRQMMWLTQMVLKRTRVWISERDVLAQAPWGEDAVQSFYGTGRSFEELLGEFGVGGAIPAVEGATAQATAQATEQAGEVEKRGARSTRRQQVVLGNVDDAFRYMERRFKPGNYSPMNVIVDAAFDGIKVRVCRVKGRVAIEFSEDERKKGMPACEGTVVVEALARWAVGGKDRDNVEVDFDIEADIVAWNSMKGCAEPRFVLEALMEADRGLQEGTRVVCDSQPMHGVARGHLEILVLVTDIVSVGDESMVDQYLYVRQESLVSFGATHWGAELGFRMPVRVMPLVPGSTRIDGTLISEVFDDPGAIKAFQQSVQHLGAKGVMLRAPEAEWSTVEKMARVQVTSSMGLSIINCAVMGYWRDHREDGEGRVSHWLLGVVDQDEGGGDLSMSHDCMTAILKLRNHLHMTDERAALETLETDVAPVPEQTGMYECNPRATQSAQVLISVAGSLLPPGKWSPSPLVLVPTLLGLSPRGSTITSMVDMRRMAEEKRMQVTREKIPSVRCRDRKVADRFIPCHTHAKPCATAGNGLLRDYNVYFVNYTTDFVAAVTRYGEKKRCEELVQALGGTVSQNYFRQVNLVIAGRPSAFTNTFREMDIDIMTVAWLERVAAAARDPHAPPTTELPGFLPEDYLPEWNPVEEHREKMNRNFLDLFTTDGPNTEGGVSPSKRFKPTLVANAPATAADAADATDVVARSPPLPSEQARARPSPISPRERIPRPEEPATVAVAPVAANAPAQVAAQAAQPTELMAENPQQKPAPRIQPYLKAAADNARGDAMTPDPAPDSAPQMSSTPSTAQRDRSLKERVSSVIAMGSSIPSPASPDGGNGEGTARPKKLSLRDRAKRLGLGTKK